MSKKIRKAFVRTFESIFAGLILITFLLYLLPSDVEVSKNMANTGYEILYSLNNKDIIRNNINNVSFINDHIKIPGFNHSIVICNAEGNCNGKIPDTDEIWVSDMVVSSNGIYVVRLYIW